MLLLLVALTTSGLTPSFPPIAKGVTAPSSSEEEEGEEETRLGPLGGTLTGMAGSRGRGGGSRAAARARRRVAAARGGRGGR